MAALVPGWGICPEGSLKCDKMFEYPVAVRRSQYVQGRDEDTAAHPPSKSISYTFTQY